MGGPQSAAAVARLAWGPCTAVGAGASAGVAFTTCRPQSSRTCNGARAAGPRVVLAGQEGAEGVPGREKEAG